MLVMERLKNASLGIIKYMDVFQADWREKHENRGNQKPPTLLDVWQGYLGEEDESTVLERINVPTIFHPDQELYHVNLRVPGSGNENVGQSTRKTSNSNTGSSSSLNKAGGPGGTNTVLREAGKESEERPSSSSTEVAGSSSRGPGDSKLGTDRPNGVQKGDKVILELGIKSAENGISNGDMGGEASEEKAPKKKKPEQHVKMKSKKDANTSDEASSSAVSSTAGKPASGKSASGRTSVLGKIAGFMKPKRKRLREGSLEGTSTGDNSSTTSNSVPNDRALIPPTITTTPSSVTSEVSCSTETAPRAESAAPVSARPKANRPKSVPARPASTPAKSAKKLNTKSPKSGKTVNSNTKTKSPTSAKNLNQKSPTSAKNLNQKSPTSAKNLSQKSPISATNSTPESPNKVQDSPRRTKTPKKRSPKAKSPVEEYVLSDPEPEPPLTSCTARFAPYRHCSSPDESTSSSLPCQALTNSLKHTRTKTNKHPRHRAKKPSSSSVSSSCYREDIMKTPTNLDNGTVTPQGRRLDSTSSGRTLDTSIPESSGRMLDAGVPASSGRMLDNRGRCYGFPGPVPACPGAVTLFNLTTHEDDSDSLWSEMGECSGTTSGRRGSSSTDGSVSSLPSFANFTNIIPSVYRHGRHSHHHHPRDSRHLSPPPGPSKSADLFRNHVKPISYTNNKKHKSRSMSDIRHPGNSLSSTITNFSMVRSPTKLTPPPARRGPNIGGRNIFCLPNCFTPLNFDRAMLLE